MGINYVRIQRKTTISKVCGEKWYDMWLNRMENTPPFIEEWVSHQTRDNYWKHGSIGEDYSAIKIPVLTMSGWADGYTNALFRLMNNLDVPKKGLLDLGRMNFQTWPFQDLK